MSVDQFQNVNNLGFVWSSVEDVLGRLGWFWLTEKLFVLVQFDVWKCLEHILSVEYLKAIQIHIVISFFLLFVTHRLSFWTQIHKCWIKKYDKTNASTHRKMQIQIRIIIIIIHKLSKSWIVWSSIGFWYFVTVLNGGAVHVTSPDIALKGEVWVPTFSHQKTDVSACTQKSGSFYNFFKYISQKKICFFLWKN